MVKERVKGTCGCRGKVQADEEEESFFDGLWR